GGESFKGGDQVLYVGGWEKGARGSFTSQDRGRFARKASGYSQGAIRGTDSTANTGPGTSGRLSDDGGGSDGCRPRRPRESGAADSSGSGEGARLARCHDDI